MKSISEYNADAPKLLSLPNIYRSEVRKKMKPGMKTIALLGFAMLSAPLFADQAEPARPGTVNYVEGAAYLEGKQLNPHDVGSIEMNAGQELTTGNGKAEILLTPGVFLRIDNNSAVKMISPEITPTQVEIDRGRAAVEVDEIYKQNDLEVMDAGVTTHLAKDGYYEFDANQPSAKVYKGEAVVDLGDGKYKTLKSGHEIALAQGATEKPAKFNKDQAQDDLYKWSSLRSQYLADANQQIAGEYASAPGFNPGWYWDPYMLGYTFIGAGPFYSPFGWGFYPPWWGGGLYGGGFYGHPYWHGGYRDLGHHGFRSGVYSHGPIRGGAGFHGEGGFHGGGSFHGANGFHGGSVAGGGFHGGAGRR